MKKTIFTIVAKNYIGLAQILEKSVRRLHDDTDFYIFAVDRFECQPQLPPNVIMVEDTDILTAEQYMDMAFKYDLTEFCTSVKPGCFAHLFARGYDTVIYFDPDIYVFSPLTEIFTALESHDVVLTPQIAGIHVHYQGEHPEWAMNVNGVFNLGFCAMRHSEVSCRVVAWWHQRLLDNAFADRSAGNFTDQKWMDWLPAFIGSQGLCVMHHLGMNMAPWNFFERQLVEEDGTIKVRFRTDDNGQHTDPLVFLHFAGYDYTKLKEGIIARKRIENLQEYADISLATDIYRDEIQQNRETFDRYISQQYSFDHYDNGQHIDGFHRRLYHGLTTMEGVTVRNPFATGTGTYHQSLRRRGMLTQENIDRMSKTNVPNMGRKRVLIGRLFGLLYRLMGYKRYVLFVKSLYNYCRPEWHTFLIKK